MLPNNLRSIVRALEIYHKTGSLPSLLREKKGLPYPVLIIGLTAEREHLYSPIDSRTDRMIAAGFVREVKGLLDMGYNRDLSSMYSLGYRQLVDHLAGNISLQEAAKTIKYETHRFARSQYAWFRLSDSRIQWFEAGDKSSEKAWEVINPFMQTAGRG